MGLDRAEVHPISGSATLVQRLLWWAKHEPGLHCTNADLQHGEEVHASKSQPSPTEEGIIVVMVQPTTNQPNQATPPIMSLGSRIEELFVQQHDRLAFHNNVQENDYRRQEERLSSLMLDKTLTNEAHLEHARGIIGLTEKYKGGFVKSLHSLNADIDRHLAAFEEQLETLLRRVQGPTPELTTVLEKLRRWLSLSKELQKARLVAVQTIVVRVDCDTTLPNILIRNEGRTDVTLTAEESGTFQQTLIDITARLKQSFEDNERIQKERLPLAQELFSSEDTAANAKQPPIAHSEPSIQTAKSRGQMPSGFKKHVFFNHTVSRKLLSRNQRFA